MEGLRAPLARVASHRARRDADQPSHHGAHHPHSPLQSLLYLLQRVRRLLAPPAVLRVGPRPIELGFPPPVGIFHDGDAQLRPLGESERKVYLEMKGLENRHFARLNFFQDAIAHGKPNQWRCRAGARYMYICEDGLVHYCSQQRGFPAIPLEKYTRADIRREYLTEKSCAPYCTVSCVHYVSYYDFFRGKQTLRQEVPDNHPHPLVNITKSGT